MSRWARYLPALLWMAVIWWSSSRTWHASDALLLELPRWVLAALAVVPPDKLVHAGIYFILALLWRWGLEGKSAARLWAPAAATIFGAVDEIHQGWVPGRSSDPWDLLADAVGASLAILLWSLWRLARRSPLDLSAASEYTAP